MSFNTAQFQVSHVKLTTNEIVPKKKNNICFLIQVLGKPSVMMSFAFRNITSLLEEL